MPESELKDVRIMPIKLRSKGGCLICKIRKRKCDEVKPKCGHCERRGEECSWLTEANHRELYQKLESFRSQGKRYEVRLKYEAEPSAGQRICAALAPDQQNVRVSYLLATLFTGANTPCSGAGMHPLTVHTELYFADDNTSLTWGVVDAMATVFWGMTHRDNSVMLRGLQARSKCLGRLGVALSRDVASFSGDLVAAVALARSFEHMLPNAQSNWMQHSQGMARIFDAMGPRAFQSRAMLRLVENNRWAIIMSDSLFRQPSVLNSKSWKTVPWETEGHKDILQQLLDVYAQVPGIHNLWDLRAAASDEDERLSYEGELVIRLHGVFSEMQQWRTLADPELLASMKRWIPVPDTIPCPWQEAVSFAQIHHAYAIALYNMMIIVLGKYSNEIGLSIETICSAEVDGSHQLSRSSCPSLRDVPRAMILAAEEIAMIVPWTLQSRLRGAGFLYLSGPVNMSGRFWENSDPKKSAWFEEIKQQMQSRWGSIYSNSPLTSAH